MSNNTSGFRGVSRSRGKWEANISHRGIRRYLGAYETKEEAAQAYNVAALKYHGEFANLNDIPTSQGE